MIDKNLLKKLKLVVLDLDGTLLNDEGYISQETIEIIAKLRQMGVMFSFATGRLQCAIADYAAQLGIKLPLISLDGALIQSFPDKLTIFESFVPDKYVRRVIGMADRFLLKTALCHDEAIYYTEFNSAVPFILDKYGARFKEIGSYDSYTGRTLELVVAGEQNDAIKYIKGKLSFPYGFGLNLSYYKSHYHKGIYYLEVRKKGVSKGSGFKRLVKYLKLHVGETAVIGDWYNDRSLFETGALKIAVANAVPEIKKLAQLVTSKTNNEGGVAEFLEMVLRSKQG
ncbi:MAG: Cof-type HAD-IIB family hydrolase [Bacteroidota bacterium]